MTERSEWVSLSNDFTPGWPWPEDSYGLGPMYGEDGWCRGCGTPLGPQIGPVVLQGSKFPTANVWMPNWLFDVVCVTSDVAAEIVGRFNVEFGEVHKPRQGDTGVRQIRPRVTNDSWYEVEPLGHAVRARFGRYNGDQTGSTCASCGRWKWLPVGEGEAPIHVSSLDVEGADVLASPETFGDGLASHRHLLFRRPLAEFLVDAAKRNWRMEEVVLV